jgi:hypothetical protein
MTELLTLHDLPEGFSYPPEFIRIVELGLTNLEPWRILGGEQLRQRLLGMRSRYPTRHLVPFAARQDSDDVAAWDSQDPGRVVIIHDYASPGDELVEEHPSFADWFKYAIQDMLDWD